MVNDNDTTLKSEGLDQVKAGNLKKALKLFEKGSFWLEAGKVSEKMGKSRKAIEFYLKAQAFKPAASLLEKVGDFSEASEWYEKIGSFSEAADSLKHHLEGKHNCTIAKLKQNKVGRDGKAELKRLLNLLIKSDRYAEVAEWLLAMGEKLRASEYYLKASQPGKAAILYQEFRKFTEAGEAWIKAGDNKKAAEAFKQADDHIGAGKVYEISGQTEEAVTAYRRGKRADLAAKLVEAKQDFSRAAQLYEEGEQYLDAARIYRKLEKPDLVIDNVLKLSKSDEYYSKSCLLLMDACLKTESISFQSDDYLKAFFQEDLNVKTLGMVYGIAGLYETLEFYESALELFQKIGEVDGTFRDVCQRIERLRGLLGASPMAAKQILEDDFNYQNTSERLANYHTKTHSDQNDPRSTMSSQQHQQASPNIYSTSAFNSSQITSGNPSALQTDSLYNQRYRLIKKISDSDQSVIFRTIDTTIDEEVLLKVFQADESAMVDQEVMKDLVKRWRRVKHSGVMSIYDFGYVDGCYFLTLEPVDGTSWKDNLDKHGRYSLTDGVPLILELLEALTELHHAGVAHGGLSAGRVFIDVHGKVKVLNFCLPTKHDYSSTIEDQVGKQLIDHITFMSPEQVTGKDIDYRSDIYSVGLLMYQLFTEQVPFDSTELKGLVFQQLNDAPTSVKTLNPGLPDQINDLIMRCIDRDPSQRYQDCDEIKKQICDIVGISVGVEKSQARPKIINDRYEVSGEIGRGGMGVVYKAFDQSLQRIVALKFLPQELCANEAVLDDFMNEARSAARLSHTNIVTVYNIEQCGKDHFIVMEFVDGLDLRTLVENVDKLPYSSIRLISRQMCEALGYAHKQKVYHRDIKSANTLWTNENLVKITDFGLAKMAEGLLASSTRVQGSPAYMSPEQILGENVDHRTDLYSFGVTLYEIISGKVPFFKGDISHQQLHSEPEPIQDKRQDVPEDLITIVTRCLKKDPSERYQSAEEIITALKE